MVLLSKSILISYKYHNLLFISIRSSSFALFKMVSGELQLMNTFGIFEIDSDSCKESESEIILRRKIRVNVLSTSESEEIEDNYVQSTASSDII